MRASSSRLCGWRQGRRAGGDGVGPAGSGIAPNDLLKETRRAARGRAVSRGGDARHGFVARRIYRTFASRIVGGSGSAASDVTRRGLLPFRTSCHAQASLWKLLSWKDKSWKAWTRVCGCHAQAYVGIFKPCLVGIEESLDKPGQKTPSVTRRPLFLSPLDSEGRRRFCGQGVTRRAGRRRGAREILGARCGSSERNSPPRIRGWIWSFTSSRCGTSTCGFAGRSESVGSWLRWPRRVSRCRSWWWRSSRIRAGTR